ncbi:DUF2946 family protein [uncultured Parvibaculum sp.]|jgi:hypothetical protein|uniref:DUF2946 family protein n=1 Tax=Parvibaculum sp. TaxID=2024848 RepID=UPI000C4B2B9A|nr:hypothetical protein [Parvibaculum sp.]HCX67427.1 hypothetical protein [Rhodobiaceae bacterium]|tara:strand:+ start:39967 stop:40362 length:396 start_codon:yes stop_codon:yes gene_type:complete
MGERKTISAHLGGRSGALYVLLAAMLLRAFLPAGWMLAEARAPGDSLIVICTSGGLKHLLIGPDGKPAEEKTAKASDHCIFGGSVALGLANAEPGIAPGPAPTERLAAPKDERRTSAFASLYRVRAPPVRT